jgi:hypothetical protein
MSDKLSIIKSESGAVARPSEAPSVADILSAVVQKGITQENIGTLEKIVGLYERMEDKKAERQYVQALAALQAECQNVIATKDVDGKFRYAPFLDIWNAVRPAVERNHFTLQWSQEHQGDKIKVTLTLQHLSGHKRDFTYAMRLGSNAPGTPSGAQAPVLDSQAESRAKRRLLMDALNIVVDAVTAADDVGDGTMASKEETEELFKRLVTLEPDDAKRTVSERRFLALAGVDKWNQIQKVVLPILQRLIIEKERAASRKGAAA